MGMKFKYKPGKEAYFDYLKKLIGVKKKKTSKKEKKEDVEVLSLDELNK